MSSWISKKPELLPDFIIGGAMKSGTSSLHDILNMHPDVYIPKDEIGFFDIDNILQHSDYNFHTNNNWITQSMEKNPEKMWKWYQSKFQGKENFIKGEDSTTYLASKIAAKRIASQNKEIKLLFILRQPSLRAYSNYYHLLRSGRAIYNFEDTLRYSPFQVLYRSQYKDQIENYLNVIPKNRIKIILFENFIQNPELVIKDVCSFLNLEFNSIPDSAFKTHSNHARIPKNSSLQIKKNKILGKYGSMSYIDRLPFTPEDIRTSYPMQMRVINRLHSVINPKSNQKPPKIKPETKLFLDEYFKRELDGLDQLINQNAFKKWF